MASPVVSNMPTFELIEDAKAMRNLHLDGARYVQHVKQIIMPAI